MPITSEEFQSCQDIIYSNEYADYVIQAITVTEELVKVYNYDCITTINYRNKAIYVKRRGDIIYSFEKFGYRSFPKVYGLMDQSALESMGVIRVRRQPYLNLRGKDVLIGFVDTGIDYQNPVFKNADNTTRIAGIWDQTIPGTDPNNNLGYGTIYTEEDINNALKNDDPLSVVPSVDTIGHGTYLAGVAAGNEDEANDFSGVAPDAMIAMVKVKEAKEYIREFYQIPEGANCYQENDIMLAISYLLRLAERLLRPIVICIGLGTSQGDHNPDSYLDDYINSFAGAVGSGVTIAAGNEGNRGHHYFGGPGNQDYVDVEIIVESGENGFVTELWAGALHTFSVGLISPGGEYIDKIPARLNQKQRITFLLEPTTAYVYYELAELQSGNELVLIRLENPTPGIWKIRVFPGSESDRQYNMWLPIHDFIKPSTNFLKSNPDTTITAPGYVRRATTLGAYNHVTNSLYLNSGHGYSVEGDIKPDLVAPGVDVYGPGLNNTFTNRSGTSISAALAAGCVALLFEWGITLENDITMSGFKVNRFLIRGARRGNLVYPNKEWGYGELDIYNIFEALRTTV
ncbi:S8 family peptidase [Anaerosporobacter sp.]